MVFWGLYTPADKSSHRITELLTKKLKIHDPITDDLIIGSDDHQQGGHRGWYDITLDGGYVMYRQNKFLQ